MHGRKKPTGEESAEVKAERLSKLAKYRALSDASLALVRLKREVLCALFGFREGRR